MFSVLFIKVLLCNSHNHDLAVQRKEHNLYFVSAVGLSTSVLWSQMGLFYHLWWYINVEHCGIIVDRGTLTLIQKFPHFSLCLSNNSHRITGIKAQASAA